MVSLKLLALFPLALTAHAQLPNGGQYLISNVIPGNSVTQFLTVANNQIAPGSKIVSTFLNNFPPPPGQLWNFQSLGDNGFFGLYYIVSSLDPTAFFGIGSANGSPAVVSPVGTVFNVSVDAGSGRFLIGAVNAVFNFQQAGFVLTDRSTDTNLSQVPTTSPHVVGDQSQLWNIIRQ